MRVVFIGSSNFGSKILEACIASDIADVVGIVTSKKTFSISYNEKGVTNFNYSDLSDLAEKYNIPITRLNTTMNDTVLLDKIRTWKPDAFIVAGWYHMITKTWRKIAPAYGFHASLLPDYSGGAPLVWAMINGETETGLTMFKMDAGVDTGPILEQRRIPITKNDTIKSIYEQIENLGCEITSEILPKLASGDVTLRIQDESKRRVFSQRTPADGNINWFQTADYIDRFVRAQTKPYPGAFSFLGGQKVHIWKTKIRTEHFSKLEPGKIEKDIDKTIVVHCADKLLELQEISIKGKCYVGDDILSIIPRSEYQFNDNVYK